MKYIFSVFLIVFVIMFCFAGQIEDSTGKRIADKLIEHGINPYIVILMIAVLPIVELRGSIPVGIALLKLNWIYVIIFSLIGNMLPIFFILFIFGFFEKFLRRFKIFDKFFDWLFKRTVAKSKKIEKYEELGLMFFVAVPLPVTGAWTGSLVAYLMKFSYKKSLLFIFLGVIIACIIVSVLTYLLLMGYNLLI